MPGGGGWAGRQKDPRLQNCPAPCTLRRKGGGGHSLSLLPSPACWNHGKGSCKGCQPACQPACGEARPGLTCSPPWEKRREKLAWAEVAAHRAGSSPSFPSAALRSLHARSADSSPGQLHCNSAFPCIRRLRLRLAGGDKARRSRRCLHETRQSQDPPDPSGARALPARTRKPQASSSWLATEAPARRADVEADEPIFLFFF